MNLLAKLNRKLYRSRIPKRLRHMRALHPAFRLMPTEAGGYRIHWRGRPQGTARPLTELTAADRPGCFIVASGPSLRAVDLSRLRDQVCFGVNGSVALAATAGLRFRYHVIADRRFVQDRFDLARAALLSPAQCLFGVRVLSEIAEREAQLLGRDNIFVLRQLNAVYGQPKREPAEFDAWVARQPELLSHPAVRLASDRVGFSKRLQSGVFSGQTVVFSALQAAYALGYKRVFILGMDLGGSGRSQTDYQRFYESSGNAATTRLDRDFKPYIVPAFEVVRALCQSASEDFAVYNLSADSRLPAEVIPKLTLDDALAMAGGRQHAERV